MTVIYNNSVRINMPVEIGPYTFTDTNTKAVIDLTADFVAVSVVCELKLRGAVFSSIAGAFVNAAGGIVHVPSYVFTTPGIWTYQFCAVDAGGDELWGEPVQFQGVGNVPDAALNALLPY